MTKFDWIEIFNFYFRNRRYKAIKKLDFLASSWNPSVRSKARAYYLNQRKYSTKELREMADDLDFLLRL